MILDNIKNSILYKSVLPGLESALGRAASYTADNYPGGRVDIDGDDIFLLLNTYETHPLDTACFEAHRKYADVMYMIEGEETIYVKNTDALTRITKPYDEAIDATIAELDGDATAVRLLPGMFILLLPGDAHAPGCHTDISHTVKKIIAKIKL